MQIRVHELAKELKISTKALREHLTDMDVIVKSHMSLVDSKVADEIRNKYNEQIAAEKKAEKDRRRLIEMRQAAKAEKAAIKKRAAKPSKEKKKAGKPEQVDELVLDKAAKDAQELDAVEPEQPKIYVPPKKAAPKHKIIVPYTQATPVQPRGRRTAKSRATDDAPAKRQARGRRRPAAADADRAKASPPDIPIQALDGKKFGKAKPMADDLAEKSRRRKAVSGASRRSRRRERPLHEADEAEISRNIKKVMQKTSKRKKYHREAQQIREESEAPAVISEYTSVNELAKILNVTAAEIISKFFAMGQLVTINQRLDRDSLEMICDEFNVDFSFEEEYGAEILDREMEQYDEVEEEPRPPVVTIMGHVDHGKTSILDYIRNTNMVAGESGSITQHIGAYQIEINDNKITFLDTPGHEAFTAMRSRGANITDIAVIVVSASEGIKPQTKEAIDHAKAAGVSLIVAINKVDLPDANVDRVIAQLLDYGVLLEQYGGDVPWTRTSVVSGEGILNLIELILLTSEMMELKARREVPGVAIVIESSKDTRMGSMATLLMEEGTLSKGDIYVCGATHGRVRRIENERGQEVTTLYPADVGRIYGLSDTPKAGDVLNQVDSEKTARSISTERSQIRMEREKYQNKSSLENIFARIQEEQTNELNIIIKTDTDGSAEALADSLQKLSNPEVQVNILHKSVGGISETDVNLASASNAVILGFHVRASQQARKLAEDEGVEIKIYQIIYDAIEDVRQSLVGMLEPEFEEQVIGSATVRQVFKIKKVGTVAGCQVDRGSIKRGCKVRLYRNDVLVAEDDLSSLKHYADDVKEARAGTECGLSLEKFSDIKEGDVLECYVLEEVARKL